MHDKPNITQSSRLCTDNSSNDAGKDHSLHVCNWMTERGHHKCVKLCERGGGITTDGYINTYTISFHVSAECFSYGALYYLQICNLTSI